MPLQGGYVAKLCPVRAQNDTLQPGEPLPVSPILERRFAKGRKFEAEVVAELLQLHPDAVTVAGEDAVQVEWATAAAMEGGASLILNARLPADVAGRRVGKPDLLVAASAGGYRAVDIKHHAALEAAEGSSGGLPGCWARSTLRAITGRLGGNHCSDSARHERADSATFCRR